MSLKHKIGRTLCLALLAAFWGSATVAQEADESNNSTTDGAAEQDQDPERGIWKWNVAVFARYGPSYPASENQQFNIIPLPYPQYSGKILKIGQRDDRPVTTRLFERDKIKLDITFGLNFPVDSEEVEARTDMPDLDLLLEAGPEMEFKFARGPANGDLYFSPQLKGALSFDGIDPTWRGAIFGAQLKYETQLQSGKTAFRIRLTPEWANSKYMDYFYGVAPEFSNPLRSSYDARSGYLGTSLTFSSKHQLRDDFQLRTGLRFGFYQGAKNDDSPLYTADTTVGIYGIVLWKFWQSRPSAE